MYREHAKKIAKSSEHSLWQPRLWSAGQVKGARSRLHDGSGPDVAERPAALLKSRFARDTCEHSEFREIMGGGSSSSSGASKAIARTKEQTAFLDAASHGDLETVQKIRAQRNESDISEFLDSVLCSSIPALAYGHRPMTTGR